MGINIIKLSIKTHGPMKLFDITEEVNSIVCGIRGGFLIIHVKGATPGLVVSHVDRDTLWNVMSRIAPIDRNYKHGNAYAHIRSTILSTSLELPILDGRVYTGGRRIYLLEIEPRRRTRELILTLIT